MVSNFESHLNPDERILELEIRKREILEELNTMHHMNREDLETEISNKEAKILETKDILAAYTQPRGENKEEFDFDGYPKDVAKKIQELVDKKKDLIEKKKKLVELLNGDPELKMNQLLEDLKDVENELN